MDLSGTRIKKGGWGGCFKVTLVVAGGLVLTERSKTLRPVAGRGPEPRDPLQTLLLCVVTRKNPRCKKFEFTTPVVF